MIGKYDSRKVAARKGHSRPRIHRSYQHPPNGIPANFKALSETFSKANIPLRATTGYVTVTQPGGTLTNNVSFHVIT